jgi:hypothetical protein
VVCPLRIAFERTQALPAFDSGDAITGNGVFRSEGVVATDRFEPLPDGLAARGSWLGTDEFQGRHETRWFRAAQKISVMVAGFPLLGGNGLRLEVRRPNGAVMEVPFQIHDIGDTWLRWTESLPEDAEAVRIVATDATMGPGGWLAFSEPFTSAPVVASQVWGLFQLLTATCLALTLIYGPGLLWFGAAPREPWSIAFAVLPGPLLLAGVGLISWLMGGIAPPALIARVGVVLLLVWIGWRAWRQRAGAVWPSEIRTLLVVGALLSGFAVAKANVSFGPTGELFRDRVSRTLAVGNHSDSQISFHLVQVIAHHLGPYSPQTKLYYAPWRFASRGPIAGLAASPLVLASGARVPFDHPTHPWRPFDREGFAVYRIACIVIASLAAWVVFGLVTVLASPAWGRVALAMAVLAPFFVHEMYFSWPKLMAGALVLLAFLALQLGKPFLAGLIIAIGYLYHPLAALSAPFLGLWLLGRRTESSWKRRLVTATLFVAGALTLVVPWQIVGRLQPDDGANQDIFVQYFFFADGAHATWRTWLQSRWDNFAHTFIPGYLFTADPAHESLNSAYGRSDRWVQASFLYWNTLPFALGLPAFCVVAVALAHAARRAFAVVAVTIIGPALFLVAYWGAASTGLMRQCGHALFLSVIVMAVWSCAKWDAPCSRTAMRIFLHPACFVWRGVEIAIMAFGTTLLNRQPELAGLFGWSDLVSIACAVGLLAITVVVLVRASPRSRSQLQRE